MTKSGDIEARFTAFAAQLTENAARLQNLEKENTEVQAKNQKQPMMSQPDSTIIDLNEPILATDAETNPADLSTPYGIQRDSNQLNNDLVKSKLLFSDPEVVRKDFH